MYHTLHERSIRLNLASKSIPEAWLPQSASERAQVREQLKHVLAHPLFNQSKRYPTMLRYVVEQTLLGNVDSLKERSIGVEVFGRDPSYDPGADPVVRFTASEIRKRLAQYYMERSHSAELQIDLPVGSYAAVFHFRPMVQEPEAMVPSPDPVIRSGSELPQPEESAPQAELPKQIAIAVPAEPLSDRRSYIAKIALSIIVACFAGVWIGYFLLRPMRPPVDSMDQFWSTLTASPGIVTVCVGVPNLPINSAAGQTAPTGVAASTFWNDSSHLAISDVIALTHLTSTLDSHGKNYRITDATKTSFFQLREGPVILIGAFDNPWTMRLMQNLRYTFVHQTGESVGIVDSRNPSQVHWSLPFDPSSENFSHDYGVVARFHDSTTGQPVVLVAGVAAAGTESASEILSNRAFFADMVKDAPHNWANMNMEIVLETQVIDGHPGPPKVLATAYW